MSNNTSGPIGFTDDRHTSYRLNEDAMRKLVDPPLNARADRSAPVVVPVPAPSGEIVHFRTQPVELMDAALAAAHTELRAFAGTSVDDSAISIRGDVTPAGIHISVRYAGEPDRAWYVDPIDPRNPSAGYVSYAGGSLTTPRHSNLGDDLDDDAVAATEAVRASAPDSSHFTSTPGDAVEVRTIRVAFASDPSFANFYGSENVLGAKFAILNRIAGVYNADLATHLILANGTDRLNFDTAEKAFDPNGPCGVDPCYRQADMGSCTVEALYQNRTAVRVIVGDDNYDVGHLLLGNAGGGLAGYGEVGLYDAKGGGCTGTPTPVGDAFAIDYVAHEIGHQVGGSHTFNACGGSSGTTAVEPGSGSTIMAYAGICGANDLQPHTDPYFSAASIEEIHRTLDQRIPARASANHNPVVSASAPREIPARTPFTLTASASDPDGDPLTYMWEQTDVGDPDRALSDGYKTAGPLFRVFGKAADVTGNAGSDYYSPGENLAGSDPSRTFPDISQIEDGYTNADTGSCDATDAGQRRDCFSEYLPTELYTGDLNFRVTARDGRLDGGGLATGDVRLTVNETAGPLEVDPLPGSGTFDGGSVHRITWQVNDTDRAGLAPLVRITAATHGDSIYDDVIVPSTPNDGAVDITLPNVDSDEVRIRVEAIDNYFFAVSPQTLKTQAVSAPTPTPVGTPTSNPTQPAPPPTSDGAAVGTPTPIVSSGSRPLARQSPADLASTGASSGASWMSLIAATLIIGGVVIARRRTRRR